MARRRRRAKSARKPALGRRGGPTPIRLLELAGVAIAAVGGTVALFFTFLPGCRPEEPCRGALKGDLSAATLDREMTYRAYLDLINAGVDRTPPRRLRESGELVSFIVETAGFKGRPLQVRWWVLGASHRRVPDPMLTDKLVAAVKPEDCTDRAGLRFWAPQPRGSGPYVIEIRLLDPRGIELDRLRTAAFAGLASS